MSYVLIRENLKDTYKANEYEKGHARCLSLVSGSEARSKNLKTIVLLQAQFC